MEWGVTRGGSRQTVVADGACRNRP